MVGRDLTTVLLAHFQYNKCVRQQLVRLLVGARAHPPIYAGLALASRLFQGYLSVNNMLFFCFVITLYCEITCLIAV